MEWTSARTTSSPFESLTLVRFGQVTDLSGESDGTPLASSGVVVAIMRPPARWSGRERERRWHVFLRASISWRLRESLLGLRSRIRQEWSSQAGALRQTA